MWWRYVASETDDGDPATFQDNDFENKITIYLSVYTELSSN